MARNLSLLKVGKTPVHGPVEWHVYGKGGMPCPPT